MEVILKQLVSDGSGDVGTFAASIRHHHHYCDLRMVKRRIPDPPGVWVIGLRTLGCPCLACRVDPRILDIVAGSRPAGQSDRLMQPLLNEPNVGSINEVTSDNPRH